MKSINRNFTILIFFLVNLAILIPGKAQFTLTGEVRPRAEFRNGFKSPIPEPAEPAFFIEQRSRLYLLYKKDKLSINITLQDIRVWGNFNQVYKSDPALTNLYEAWGQYHFDDRMSIRIGRQALDYNNARFLGNLDWAQQGRSHDALLFISENPERNCQLHIGGAYNQGFPFEPAHLQGTTYLNRNNYKTMQFAWWNKQFDRGDLSLLVHNDGRQVATDTSMAYRQTYAVIGSYGTGDIELGGEFYYQDGRNTLDVKVSAFLIALNLQLNTEITPVVVGLDYLSGTSLDDPEDRSFAPLYGTNHKFYGFMDYFYVGNAHGQTTYNSGLTDVYIKTRFNLGERSNLLAHAHYFRSPVEIYDPQDLTGTENPFLGTEIDLVYQLNVLDDLKFHIGYSHMFQSNTLGVIKGNIQDPAPVQNWAWMMIAFKPEIFSSER